MSTFEFITILLSIVIGLGITRLLTGIGRVMELRTSIRIYWVQIIWFLNVGFYLVLYWWGVVFTYSSTDTFLLVNFLILLFYATLLYIQASLIIPGRIEEQTDLKEYFFSIRPWFFYIGASIPVLELASEVPCNEP